VEPNEMPEKCELWEQIKWKCKINDNNLLTYLQAARSIAAFAGMCDRGNTDDMYDAAQRDDTTINALNILHENHYDTGRALQCLVKCPIPKGVDRKWTDEEQVSNLIIFVVFLLLYFLILFRKSLLKV
jgi:arginine-glutamic acid dipeptide repeat-containing protein